MIDYEMLSAELKGVMLNVQALPHKKIEEVASRVLKQTEHMTGNNKFN